MIKQNTPSFALLENTGKLMYASRGAGDHVDFHGHDECCTSHRSAGGATYGFIMEGMTILTYKVDGMDYAIPLREGMYFSVSGDFSLTGGKGIYVRCPNQDCMNTIGGPIEREGRLRYIDGCTDSLILPPMVKGLGCLNLLHFPAGIDQTMHTHPSVRIGVIARGSGECITPFGNLPLKKGDIFIIKENSDGGQSVGEDGGTYWDGSHKFKTTDDIMDVIAFHPDSDFGPEHKDHPMINRTIVDGVSANQMTDIQTS